MKTILKVMFIAVVMSFGSGCGTVQRSGSRDVGVISFFGCSWPAPQNTINLINRTPYVLKVRTTGVDCCRFEIAPLGSYDLNLNCFSGGRNSWGGNGLSINIMAFSNGQYVGGEDRVFQVFNDGGMHCQNWSFDGATMQNQFRSTQTGGW